MSNNKDKRRLTGYSGNTIGNQSVYDDYHDDTFEEYDEDSDSHEEEEEHEVAHEDDTGSELSIPDADIDFDLVYALHTFSASVEGQATVVRGDALTLLDDSNSYWWLVKVLKTAEVGYIPAENIETPHERLARLNSHRNIEITRKDNFDAFPVPPSTNPTKTRKRVTLAKGVQYQSQIIFGSSDSEDDDFEAEFQEWDEKMRSSDESDLDSSTSGDDEDDDPYHYYDEPQPIYPNQPHRSILSEEEDEKIIPNLDSHLSADSDIINDPRDFICYQGPQEMEQKKENDSDYDDNDDDFKDETIKISLTPSIARGSEDSRRDSDTSIQTKLKKAAKLERLLASSSSPSSSALPDKKEKKASGIRKFFSRSKKPGSNSSSNSSNNIDAAQVTTNDTLSHNSSQPAIVNETTRLKIQPGNPTMKFKESYIDVYPNTTACEVIQQILDKEKELEQESESSYNDYYLIVKTLSGDECTLIPSDKPLEIFYSLTAHLNTPMPSLKKARRISQMMGSDNHVGGPVKDETHDEVQFFLFSKTKRIEDGEIQIKVSLLPSDQMLEDSKRVDKLVKIPCSFLIKDVVTLLLEKFHILNGIVAGDDDKKSLRLTDENEIAKYQLAMSVVGQERLLPLNEKLLTVFGDDIPQIHYRRNSNPDRSSITVNITPPEKNETYFLLRCVERPKKKEIEKQTTEEPRHSPHHHLVRQDTPMPRKEPTPDNGFQPPTPTILSTSPKDELLTQIDEAIQDTLSHSSPSIISSSSITEQPTNTIPQRHIRPSSTESILFYTSDFGVNDLMVIIRGAAALHEINPTSTTATTLRSEISDVFKDTHSRLDQLEKVNHI
ncbi:unnamed protein product [Rhizopus microsporus]